LIAYYVLSTELPHSVRTGWTVEESRFSSPQEQEIFSDSDQIGSGANLAPIDWVPGAVKRQEREADDSFLRSAFMAWYLINEIPGKLKCLYTTYSPI
jgi:hypothetical protein